MSPLSQSTADTGCCLPDKTSFSGNADRLEWAQQWASVLEAPSDGGRLQGGDAAVEREVTVVAFGWCTEHCALARVHVTCVTHTQTARQAGVVMSPVLRMRELEYKEMRPRSRSIGSSRGLLWDPGVAGARPTRVTSTCEHTWQTRMRD